MFWFFLIKLVYICIVCIFDPFTEGNGYMAMLAFVALASHADPMALNEVPSLEQVQELARFRPLPAG